MTTVLIVEDSSFNGFCLKRLIEANNKAVQINIVHDSFAALHFLAKNKTSLVILDGFLGASDGLNCNGPVLASLIWLAYPQLPIVAWSDSELMRAAFVEVFRQHKKTVNEYNFWPKVVGLDRIAQSLPYLLANQTNDYFHNTKQEQFDKILSC